METKNFVRRIDKRNDKIRKIMLHSYKDICLNSPNYSTIVSRSELSTEVEFLGQKFKSPVLPANMKCSISFEKAEELSENGYFYILHRFYDYEEIKNWIKNNQHLKTISISLGVKQKDYEFIEWLAHRTFCRVDYITIDVAHGHHVLVRNIIDFINSHKEIFKKDPKIIAGNIITKKAVFDLKSWGVDAVKCGIAQGRGCSTFNTTGVGCPQFSAVLECSKPPYFPINRDTIGEYVLPVIADGGVREIGDYCKALVAGASMVMSGSEFVKCIDSPAEPMDYKIGGNPKTKKYYGSASSENKGSEDYVEGFNNVLLECNDLSYLQYYEKIKQGIQSCMSYHNIRNISEFNKIQWSTANE